MAVLLVIDDSAPLRQMVCEMLAGAGHDFIEAADGEIGLRLFKEHSPTLVITDLLMPNREGIETIRDIRRLDATIKIIAMTGSDPTERGVYLRAARQLGADATIEKPFHPDELRGLVDQLLDASGNAT